MDKIISFIKKILFFSILFVAGVTGTIFLMSQETTDDRGDMNNPTLPEVMMEINGSTLNRMIGYRQKMQVDFTRDSLTPVDSNKDIHFVVDSHDQDIKSLAYEIRTSDGSTVMENRKLKNLQEDEEGIYRVHSAVEFSMKVSQEYSMSITLETGVGTVYYYTRIIQRSAKETVSDYLTFAKDYSETSVDKENAGGLYNYLEPEESYADVNFNRVNIHSEWDTITWGEMHPTITQHGVPTLKEINETTGSVTMEYQIAALDENGKQELYEVTDFYRLRDTELGVALLEFNREMQQVFDGTLNVISSEGLLLGIRDRNVHYMMNEGSTIVAFVQQGDLWTYTPETDRFVRVFTFRKDRNSELRDSRTEHDMKIIRVSEQGDVDFALYGYMNRGIHEGYSGISVCHYDSEQNVVEEKVFIPSTQSFEFLKENMGILSYVNESNQLFLLFAGKLYQVDVDGRTYQILDQGIDSESFHASDTNAHAAWLTENSKGVRQLKEIDFDTGKIRLIDPGANQLVQVLGFFNEDVIYGVALEENTMLDIRGNEVIGMSLIRIEDFNGNVKKSYDPGYLMINAKISSTIMEMELVQKEGSGYKVIRTENIMNSQKVAGSSVNFELTYDNRRSVMILMAFSDDIGSEAPFAIYAKNRLSEKVEIPLDTSVPEQDLFYVYGGGKMVGTFASPAEAVIAAEETMGVVLNRNQQYIWERGNRRSSISLTLAHCPQVFLTGTLDINVLQQRLGDTGKVLDLTGCSLDSVLYMVSQEKPVVVKTGTRQTRVIVAYDETEIWLYDPVSTETTGYTIEECEEMFAEYENVFVTYMDL